MNMIKKQWNEMINRGTTPMFEFELKHDEYLLVDLELTDKGIEFSGDFDGFPVSFDGDVETIHSNRYLVPFNEYWKSLDTYLEEISENIHEGFICLNGLYREQD